MHRYKYVYISIQILYIHIHIHTYIYTYRYIFIYIYLFAWFTIKARKVWRDLLRTSRQMSPLFRMEDGGTPIWVWYMKMMGSFGQIWCFGKTRWFDKPVSLEIIILNCRVKYPSFSGIKPTSSYPNWEVCCRCHELITGAAPWWKRGKIIPTKPCWSDVKCAAHWPNLGFNRLIASFLATN